MDMKRKVTASLIALTAIIISAFAISSAISNDFGSHHPVIRDLSVIGVESLSYNNNGSLTMFAQLRASQDKISLDSLLIESNDGSMTTTKNLNPAELKVNVLTVITANLTATLSEGTYSATLITSSGERSNTLSFEV
jgi:hypothetical protein